MGDILNSAPFTGEHGGLVLIAVVFMICFAVGIIVEEICGYLKKASENTRQPQPEVDDDDEEEDPLPKLLKRQNELSEQILSELAKLNARNTPATVAEGSDKKV